MAEEEFFERGASLRLPCSIPHVLPAAKYVGSSSELGKRTLPDCRPMGVMHLETVTSPKIKTGETCRGKGEVKLIAEGIYLLERGMETRRPRGFVDIESRI